GGGGDGGRGEARRGGVDGDGSRGRGVVFAGADLGRVGAVGDAGAAGGAVPGDGRGAALPAPGGDGPPGGVAHDQLPAARGADRGGELDAVAYAVAVRADELAAGAERGRERGSHALGD